MLLGLMACHTEVECAAGFTLGDDGMCYAVVAEGADTDLPEDTGTPDEAPTMVDVLETLPACEPLPAGDRLDLVAACADGACAGMTYDRMAEAIGEEAWCEGWYIVAGGDQSNFVDCTWPNGVSAYFDDDNRDGIADATDIASGVQVDYAFDGASADGLGINANFSCFRDWLGDPEEVWVQQVDKDWYVTHATWEAGSLQYTDYTDPLGSWYPDGAADALALYGLTGEL